MVQSPGLKTKSGLWVPTAINTMQRNAAIGDLPHNLKLVWWRIV